MLVGMATVHLVATWLISLGILVNPLNAGQHGGGRIGRGLALGEGLSSHDEHLDFSLKRCTEFVVVLGRPSRPGATPNGVAL